MLLLLFLWCFCRIKWQIDGAHKECVELYVYKLAAEHQQFVQCLESRATVAAGPRSAQARPLHRVRCRRAGSTNLHVRAHRALVRLYLVHYRRLGGTQGSPVRLAAAARQRNRFVIIKPSLHRQRKRNVARMSHAKIAESNRCFRQTVVARKVKVLQQYFVLRLTVSQRRQI